MYAVVNFNLGKIRAYIVQYYIVLFQVHVQRMVIEIRTKNSRQQHRLRATDNITEGKRVTKGFDFSDGIFPLYS